MAKRTSSQSMSTIDHGNRFPKKEQFFFEPIISEHLFIVYRVFSDAENFFPAFAWFEMNGCDNTIRVGPTRDIIVIVESILAQLSHIIISPISADERRELIRQAFPPALFDLLNVLMVVTKIIPPNTQAGFDKYVEKTGDYVLSLLTGNVDDFEQITSSLPVDVLLATPGKFQILYPHQYQQFVSQVPFFYEDDSKSFFVVPQDPPPPPFKFAVDSFPAWRKADEVTFSMLDDAAQYYGAQLGLAFGTRGLKTHSVRSAAHAMQGATGVRNFGASDFMIPWSLVLDLVFDIPKYYKFHSFYHPYVCEFIKQLNRYGIAGLLNPSSVNGNSELQRQLLNAGDNFFDDRYDPWYSVLTPHPVEDIDFELEGAYALYN